MEQKSIFITKMSGEKAKFNKSKLRHSLERSGASAVVIQQVINKVVASLYDGITTKQIYKTAFALLRKTSRPTAARYKLKKAIFELGPTGFPFEKFVGKILDYQGFRTRVGVIVKGHCVNHEVDVIAEKDEKHFMVECKFHSDQGRHCDVKIPLYIHSRFLDVEKAWEKQDGHETKFHQGCIFTNTRFTTDAIQYGNCAGLMLVSWDYPNKGSLKERVDQFGLHPLTVLTILTIAQKTKLLNKGIVLCKELIENPNLLEQIGIPKAKHKDILRDSFELCKTH